MLLVKHTPMALGIPSPQLNQQRLYKHSIRLPSILHQFAGHVLHAPSSLLVSKAARHFRAIRHAHPASIAYVLTATSTQTRLCDAVQAGGGVQRRFYLTQSLTHSILSVFW